MVQAAYDDPLRSAAMLQELLLNCVAWKRDGDLPGEDAESRLRMVHKHVQKNYREPLEIDQLAILAAMSRRNLTRTFKRKYGLSLKELQIRLRMNAASLMLKTTNMQIQQIAAEVGYGDLYQFTAAFTLRNSMSPTAYRLKG